MHKKYLFIKLNSIIIKKCNFIKQKVERISQKGKIFDNWLQFRFFDSFVYVLVLRLKLHLSTKCVRNRRRNSWAYNV